jgi:hypothetical protein
MLKLVMLVLLVNYTLHVELLKQCRWPISTVRQTDRQSVNYIPTGPTRPVGSESTHTELVIIGSCQIQRTVKPSEMRVNG